MKASRKAKSAFLTSLISLVLCFSMLLGTTYAWFTDTASTGVNQILAGTLDVEVDYYDQSATTPTWKTIEDATSLFSGNLWEPGHTEYVYLRVKNAGSLALKYKVMVTPVSENGGINVYNANFKLSDSLVFGTKVIGTTFTPFADRAAARAAVAGIEKGLRQDDLTKTGEIKTDRTAETAYDYLALVVYMPETVGNEANAKPGTTPPSINLGIKVVATQKDAENDSFGNTYDKDAAYLMYPSGVTAQSFADATSVEYTNNLGQTVTGEKPAVAAYVDSEGNVKYVGDIYAAVQSGATEIYCKQNTTLRMRERLEDTNRSPDLTDNLTIYANGADFQYGEISMNMTDTGKASPITLKVYDAKNIKVWGATPTDGVTQTIVMENCTNIGRGRTGDAGILMYITGNTGTVNATVKDCYVTANSSGIYMSTNGSLTVTGSTFVDCATGIKTSYKGTGTRTDRIENCVFTNCGCTAEMAGDTAWLKDDSAAYKYKNSSTGTISLTTKGNTITGTIGDKGDTQIVGDVTVTNE